MPPLGEASTVRRPRKKLVVMMSNFGPPALRSCASTRGTLGLSMKPNVNSMDTKSSLSLRMTARDSSATRGVSAVSTLRITLRSCSTLLCFRLCISAIGADSRLLVRNTAVPFTRTGGPIFKDSIRSMIGTESRSDLACRIADPRTQVSTMKNRPPPSINGNQPPAKTFSRLALKKAVSTIRNGVTMASANQGLNFQIRVITM